jgi:uncharacterized surface protein with fasciclin (FAS1) repeats
MNNIFKIKSFFIVLLVSILGTSCTQKEVDKTVTLVPTPTITGFIAKNAELSMLLEALQKTGLDKTLDGSGTFTAFLPTNSAFKAFLGETGTIGNTSVGNLTLVLNNHVLTSVKKSTDFVTGYSKTTYPGTVAGTFLSLYTSNTVAGISLNGANVTSSNIIASNGVMHVIDKVITGLSIVNQAKANPDFSTLVKVITSDTDATTARGYGNQEAVAKVLTVNTAPLTVFAPNNSAFVALDTELKTTFVKPVRNTATKTGAGLTTAQITKILQYHVTSGSVLAASLTEGQVVTSLNSQTFKIGLVGGANILDAKSRTTNIIATDVICTNGVIHVVDKVLLPL